MKEFAKSFYQSQAWKKCRKAFFIFKNGMCEKCKIEPGLIVHHKIVLNPENIGDPYITLNWDNLELLCQSCHNKVHGESVTREDVMFDENGNLIKIICF